MIREDDLRSLANVPVGPAGDVGAAPCRPVADVLARGARLRRRRQAVRAVGVTAVVGTVAATGTLALTRNRGSGDVQTARETAETPAEEPQPLYPDPMICVSSVLSPDESPPLLGEGDSSDSPPLTADEVSDGARVIPTWTPDGIAITGATGARLTGPECDPPVARLQVTLSLTATADDGAVVRSIVLEGPYSALDEPGTVEDGSSPTQVRGQDATLVGFGAGDAFRLDWTEPDGGAWKLRGEGVSEADLRAVAENLELDSSPPPGVPPAQLAPADVPAGFEIVAQAPTVPRRAGPDPDASVISWSLTAGTPSMPQSGVLCHLDVMDFGDDEPVDLLSSAVGSRPVTVDGGPGIWAPLMGVEDPGQPGRWRQLSWNVAPNVQATADCSRWDETGGHTLPIEDMIRFAESVEPVPADDPRLPPA